MKRKIVIALIIIGLLALYLNRSYAHIFSLIGAGNLHNPTSSKSYVVNSDKTQKIKIAFLGDSLTAGVGVKWLEDTYPYVIAKKMANQYQVEVLTLGIPGAMADDVLNHQVKVVNDFVPDKVVVFVGINDMINRIPLVRVENNLQQIINNLNINKDNLFIVNIPYLGTSNLYLPPWKTYFSHQMGRYNKIFTDLKNNGYNVIDIFSTTEKQFKTDDSLYSVDQFHPGNNGYKLIADVIFRGMNL
jgi:lysophospholipase L1-like esterase